MASSSRRPLILGVLALAVAGGAYVFLSRDKTPAPSSPQYAELVSSFYVGLGALESGEGRALEKFKRVAELAPGEAAAWANLGLLQLRNNDIPAAAESLEKARALAPQSGEIESLLAIAESKRQNSAKAIEHLRRAIELNPNDLQSRYAMMQEMERQGTPEGLQGALKVLDEILQKAPENLVAHLERARLAAKANDATKLKEEVAWFDKQQSAWDDGQREQLGELKQAASAPQNAAVKVIFLGNVLKPNQRYQDDLAALAPPPNELGQPLKKFLSMPSPAAKPASADTGLSFSPQAIKAPGAWQTARVFWRDGEGAPDVLLLRDNAWQLASQNQTQPFPGKPGAALPLDWNYDFQNDLALAGSKGFRLLRAEGKNFVDATAKTKLPPAIINGNYSGAWAADVEMDGDLDIVLAAANDTPVLRNNGDGTFKVLRPFGEIGGVKDFVWADLDEDGDPDAVFVGVGADYFHNERSGVFTRQGIQQTREIPPMERIATAVLKDGFHSVLGLSNGGVFTFLNGVSEIKADGKNTFDRQFGAAGFFAADLDNNGALEIVASGAQAARVLTQAEDKWTNLVAPLNTAIFSAADANGDGRLDLLALDAKGAPQWLINKGAKNYHWLALRPRAQSGNTGDQRINSFGIGGEIGIRSGLLYQKQVIQAPVVHFGLGEHPQAEIARIVWPNGSVRSEFDLKGDQTMTALQRLVGSCPFLFAWNGTKMGFVTDCIWRSPLGLKINAQDTAGVMQTEDWVKIRGEQLVPKNGLLNLAVTAELWETHFFDHLSLMSVDHPADTEIWVDERLAFPQPPLRVYATKKPVPVRAFDDKGNEVSQTVKARDGKYLDYFGRGRYQGVTRDHWVEVEIPKPLLPLTKGEAGRGLPLYLIAHGWIHPTDSSINVAIGQGSHAPPQGLRLEVPDASGQWIVAKPGLGFPEGKLKTVVIRVDDAFKPGAPRRARLRTNLEIYWDQLAVAVGAPEANIKTQRLKAQRADLRYRGFSEVKAADASSPELPQSYENIQSTAQIWRDLIGYYTRFGDVRELLGGVDDRYVIMNAGDEMRLDFENPAPPKPGFVRDWILIGDGWVKDGNFNTTWSKTVIPLPAHNQPDYTIAPKDTWSDPVYRRHKNDWQTYHTRYVTPRAFADALRPARSWEN